MSPSATTARATGSSSRATRATAGAGSRALRRAPGPSVPRRVSGPALRPVPPRRPRSRADATDARPLATRLACALRTLSDLPLLDRLIRGRFWIGLIAFALLGIVALQVLLLGLNTGIGRDMAHLSSLQRENAALQAQVSRLSSGDRIEAAAQRQGLVMVPPGDVGFLRARPGNATRAIHTMTTPAAPGGATPAAGAPSTLTAATAAAPGIATAQTPPSTLTTTGAGGSAGAATAQTSTSTAPGPAGGGGG